MPEPGFALSHGATQWVLGSIVGPTTQAALNGVPRPASTAGVTPHAINNSAQVSLSADDIHPLPAGWGLIYDSGTGKASKLPKLSPQSGGYTSFRSLNDTGDVAGRGLDENLAPHAVLSTAATGLISLHAPGLTAGGNPIHLTEAHGINNAGQIVCTGYFTDPVVVHGFLLTPDTNPPPSLAATCDGGTKLVPSEEE